VIRRVADALLAALLAPPCAVCARVLDRPLDGAVCDVCWNAVAGTVPVRRMSRVISCAAAIGEYEGVLRDIIHALKYDGRRSVAPRLASLMARHGAEVLNGADALVPVPLHPARLRERGFNQADDLARGVGLPIERLLRRARSTVPQVELPASERHRNVRHAFQTVGGRSERTARANGRAILDAREAARRNQQWGLPARRASRLEGCILVLVDDVTTTGATLEACARELKRAGAKEVRALTAARVSSAQR
jgi:predicted amidophosphoribosyltransferase